MILTRDEMDPTQKISSNYCLQEKGIWSFHIMISGTGSSTSGNNIAKLFGCTDDFLIYVLGRGQVWDLHDRI